MRTWILVVFSCALIASCTCPPKKTSTVDPTIPDKPIDPRTRAPAVAADHPLHDRVEGIAFANGCQTDKECFTGGCGAEICSANIDATSSCDVQEWPTKGATCGCVANECMWFRQVDPDAAPAQGEPCPDNKCQDGFTCIGYYGIAGPQGPKMTSCEIPCGDMNATCPEGQKCITIADGPGQVCRPDASAAPPPVSPAPAQ